MNPEIEKRLQRIEDGIEKLMMLQLKDKVDTTWIDEKTAAETFGIGARHFRRRVIAKDFPFDYVDCRNTNGRNYQYNRKDLLKAKEKSSVYGGSKSIRMGNAAGQHKAAS